MENYIVRIYRRTGRKSEDAVGVVEFLDSGEKKSFANLKEMVKILAGQAGAARTSETSQTTEQRKYRRFAIKEGSLLFDSAANVGAIIDISMGGLAYTCTDLQDPPAATLDSGIICGEDGFCSATFNCRNLQDQREAPPETFLPAPLPNHRCRVAFADLSPDQEMQLQYIIRNYTASDA